MLQVCDNTRRYGGRRLSAIARADSGPPLRRRGRRQRSAVSGQRWAAVRYAGGGLRAVDGRLWAAGGGRQTVGVGGLWAAGGGRCALGCRRWAVDDGGRRLAAGGGRLAASTRARLGAARSPSSDTSGANLAAPLLLACLQPLAAAPRYHLPVP